MSTDMIPFVVLAAGVAAGIISVFLPVAGPLALAAAFVPIAGVGCGMVFC